MRYGYEILEDRYFSDYDYDYDYEDALYERAFCEGYEYAQREFAKEEEDKRNQELKRKYRAAGVAGAVGSAGYGLWNMGKYVKDVKSDAFGNLSNKEISKLSPRQLEKLQDQFAKRVETDKGLQEKYAKRLIKGGAATTAMIGIPAATVIGYNIHKRVKKD